MDKGQLVPAFKHQRVRVGLVNGVAMQNHARSAPRNGRDLDLRCSDRHHDGGAALEFLARQRDALRMITRGCGDHAAFEHIPRQLHHLVVGAAQLERKDRLHVLALQQQRVVDPRRQIGGAL